MKSFLKTLFILGATQAAGDAKWNYKTNGKDWPQFDATDNECGTGTNQSPIDLKTSGWPLKHSNFDNFNKIYTDQTVDVEIVWNGHTSQVALDKEGQSTQTMSSQHSADGHSGGTTYNGVQFHFHAGSEHTVDGVRQDLEMHTVHLAVDEKSGFFAAAMGIMFSVNNPTPGVTADEIAIIDEFFESLQWPEVSKTPLAEKVPYGKLMMMFDMKNRWTYKGSVTTPPCKQNVYWNVLKTIYPIKQKYVDQFTAQLDRLDGLKKTGNWREIQKLTNDHNPVVLFSDTARGGSSNSAINHAAAAPAGGATVGGQTSITQSGAYTIQDQGILTNNALLGGNAWMTTVNEKIYGAQPQQRQPAQPAQAAAAAPAAAATPTPMKMDISGGLYTMMWLLTLGIFALVFVLTVSMISKWNKSKQYQEAATEDNATSARQQ